jgi:hypothetical protein
LEVMKMSCFLRWHCAVIRAAVSLAFVLALASVATGGCPSNWDTAISWAGSVDAGTSLHVAVQGSHAWVASVANGIYAVDLAVPDRPQVLSRVVRYATRDVAVQGDHVYALEHHFNFVPQAYLDVFDASDPTAPVLEGTFHWSGRYSSRVGIQGDFAYVGFDVSAAPSLDSFFAVDVSDPSAPVPTDSLHVGTVRSLAIVGDRAYVATGAASTGIIDLSDPAHPALAGSVPGESYAVAASGALLFVGNSLGELSLFDTSVQPVTLLSRTSLWTSKVFAAARIQDIEIDGARAYVSFQGDTEVVNVADPRRPVAEGRVDSDGFDPDLEVTGALAVIADGSGLDVYRLRDGTPTHPCGLATVPFKGNPDRYYHPTPIGDAALWVQASVAITDSTSMLTTRFFDLTDPGDPRVSGTFEKVVRHADERDGLLVGGLTDLLTIDVTDPGRPRGLAQMPLDGTLQGGVILDGDIAWMGWRHGGSSPAVRAYDISDPLHPSLVGEVGLGPADLTAIAIRGDRLYVGSADRTLAIVDISDPTAPVLTDTLPTTAYPASIAVDGNHLWVTAYAAGIELRDTSNPDNPAIVATRPLPSWNQAGARSVVARNGLAYVATQYGGVVVVDGSTPDLPVVGSLYVPGESTFLGIVGEMLVATFQNAPESASGFVIAPLYPTAAAFLATDAGTRSPRVAPRNRAPSVLGAGPNPFGESVGLQFRLPSDSPVRVDVFDTAGRLVRTLRDGPLSTGTHGVRWDGRDGAGNAVGTGVYFVRVASPGGTVSRKVLRVR